jgi:hypothetical protein
MKRTPHLLKATIPGVIARYKGSGEGRLAATSPPSFDPLQCVDLLIIQGISSYNSLQIFCGPAHLQENQAQFGALTRQRSKDRLLADCTEQHVAI